jgi:type I restriction enzyme M protein
MQNLKILLQILNFAPIPGTESLYYKEYSNQYKIQIKLDETELAKCTINWGNEITIGSATTSNFSQDETLVVLECVDRLLTKGYQSQDLYLEKVYPSGHGTSGRLDILVKKEGEAFLMIECKTWGKEYDKELANTNKNGGQLFTYLQQDKAAQYLTLYTSTFQNNEIKYKNEIVVVEQSYRETSNVKDLYERWNKFTKNNGIFEDGIAAYHFESKALTTNQLTAITEKDSSIIFNRFAEILRHNAVSDKPNAFNKIFTLFLCKVKDEDKNPDEELEFQWKEGEDTNVTFQVRLTDLYKRAMIEFLEKEISDLTNDEFDRRFGTISQDLKDQLKEEFTKIRLQKNNEFAIKEVFDQESFDDNAIVLKEVVELLQPFKFRYNKKQPFLGEFFELLLTTGLKQESGQFFTPVPVARFICRSVPIEAITKQKLEKGETGELLPNIIDYSCGSGHFLTEGMEEVHNVINQQNLAKYSPATARKLQSWQQDEFSWASEYIYGIELDYRLVKTTKVGCYLHGDGIAKIIHGDGLDSFDSKNYQGKLKLQNHQTENPKFDFILSNPPYSVSSFKGNLKNKYVSKDLPKDQKPFELYDQLTDNSSEIEALFIERTKQLLKDGGIAAIILPSSILSNTGIYTRCREILFKFFEIVAITELGSNTFMATGTNTVILFLRRRNNYDSANTAGYINKFFETKIDITINSVENLPSKYVKYVWEGLSFDDYITLTEGKPNAKILESELYRDYSKKLKVKNPSELLTKIIETEKQKMLYFALAYPQKVVLVKTGEKNEEKRFLGYEFSSRRGSEGIHAIQRGKSIETCTKLFDPEVIDNPLKASTYIQQAFAGNLVTPIDESLINNITRIDLVDLMTFDRSDFEKGINTRSKKKLKIESKWEVVKLGEVCEIVSGGTPDTNIEEYWNGDINWVTLVDTKEKYLTSTKRKITQKGMEKSSATLLPINTVIFSSRATIGDISISRIETCTNQGYKSFICNQDKLHYEYLYQILKKYTPEIADLSSGMTYIEISKSQIADFKIPLPPLDIQAKIVEEISKVETQTQKAKDEIEKLKLKISGIIENAGGEELELGAVLTLEYGKALNEKDRIKGEYPVVGSNGIVGYHNSFITPNPTIIIGRKGSAGKVNYFEKKCFPIDTTYFVELKSESELKFIYHKLTVLNLEGLSKGAGVPGLNRNDVYGLKIQLPQLETQKQIVAQILDIEKQIAAYQLVLDNASSAKKAILDGYLN